MKQRSDNLKDKFLGKVFDPVNHPEDFSENMHKNNITPFKIIGYRNSKDVDIEFLDDNHYCMYNNMLKNLNNNSVKNPFQPCVYGVGYLGDKTDIYPPTVNNKGKDSPEYKKWIDMIRRCYDKKSLEKRPSYNNCKVYSKWLNYSNFAEWMSKNYYVLNGEEMHLDKDIFYKDNKLYSPKRCVIVPKRINDLFTYKVKQKSTDLPIGISTIKGKYEARIRYVDENGVTKSNRKRFDNLKDAEEWYKARKKERIIEVAKEYKKLFIKEYGKEAYKSNKYKFRTLYKAMINYEV